VRLPSVLAAVGLLVACGNGPTGEHDAGRDASHDGGSDAPFVPPDAWFGDTNAGDTGACAVTPSSDQVSMVLTASCALPACHSRASPDPGGGLILDRGTPRSQLVAVPASYGAEIYYVIPGDPQHSFLWRKLTDDLAVSGLEGTPMPPPDAMMHWTPLPADQLELVRCWIVDGAH